jgi:hypothetical protein
MSNQPNYFDGLPATDNRCCGGSVPARALYLVDG